MHLQCRLAGEKSKEEKDPTNEDEIALTATNAKKGGKEPNGGSKPKKENPNRIRLVTTAIKRGISRARAGRSTLRRSRSLQRIAKASKRAGVPSQ
jgi:hypothetical protein